VRTAPLLASALAFVAGIVTLAYLLLDAHPLTLCDLWPPPRCISGHSGLRYFTGDSQAAPFWNLMLAVVGPLIALCAAVLYLRRRFAVALAVAALACAPYALFMFGAYVVMPFHPIVAGAVVATWITVSVGTTKAVWPPVRGADSV
jgi:hypothetical protein